VLVVHALQRGAPEDARWLLALLDRPAREVTLGQVDAAVALFERTGSVDFAVGEMLRRRALALATPALRDHPKIRSVVAAMCDLFMEPLAPFLSRREEGP
jgi:hypothetical protein